MILLVDPNQTNVFLNTNSHGFSMYSIFVPLSIEFSYLFQWHNIVLGIFRKSKKVLKYGPNILISIYGELKGVLKATMTIDSTPSSLSVQIQLAQLIVHWYIFSFKKLTFILTYVEVCCV